MVHVFCNKKRGSLLLHFIEILTSTFFTVGDAFIIHSCLDTVWQYYGRNSGFGTFAIVGIIIHIMQLKETFGGTT